MRPYPDRRVGRQTLSIPPGKIAVATVRRAPAGGAGGFGPGPVRPLSGGRGHRRVRRQGVVHIARFRATPVDEPDRDF